MLKKLYYKQNETFDYEFFADVECKTPFDFESVKNIYVELKDGDCTPIFKLSNKLDNLNLSVNIFTPIWYLGWTDGINPKTPIITLNDILTNDDIQNINLSKYIPEDNAVLFLSEGDYTIYRSSMNKKITRLNFGDRNMLLFINNILEECDTGFPLFHYQNTKKITIFLLQGTQAELHKANNIAKELKEEYGVEEVNLFMLNCFCNITFHKFINMRGNNLFSYADFDIFNYNDNPFISSIYKITTTNSTGIPKPSHKNRLQVIDCFDIFDDYLK